MVAGARTPNFLLFLNIRDFIVRDNDEKLDEK